MDGLEKTSLNEAFLFSVAFQMKGNSMDNGSRWCFTNGDYLRCDEVDIQDIEVGHEYVIKIGNTYLVRQITFSDDLFFTATPFNPAYEELRLLKKDIQQIFIIKSYQRLIVN